MKPYTQWLRRLVHHISKYHKPLPWHILYVGTENSLCYEKLIEMSEQIAALNRWHKRRFVKAAQGDIDRFIADVKAGEPNALKRFQRLFKLESCATFQRMENRLANGYVDMAFAPSYFKDVDFNRIAPIEESAMFYENGNTDVKPLSYMVSSTTGMRICFQSEKRIYKKVYTTKQNHHITDASLANFNRQPNIEFVYGDCTTDCYEAWKRDKEPSALICHERFYSLNASEIADSVELTVIPNEIEYTVYNLVKKNKDLPSSFHTRDWKLAVDIYRGVMAVGFFLRKKAVLSFIAGITTSGLAWLFTPAGQAFLTSLQNRISSIPNAATIFTAVSGLAVSTLIYLLHPKNISAMQLEKYVGHYIVTAEPDEEYLKACKDAPNRYLHKKILKVTKGKGNTLVFTIYMPGRKDDAYLQSVVALPLATLGAEVGMIEIEYSNRKHCDASLKNTAC